MMKRTLISCSALALSCMSLGVVDAAAEIEAWLGPCAVTASKDGATLYVANADAGNIVLLDVRSGKRLVSIDVPPRPSGLALSPDGARLFVTCAAPRSSVAVIDTRSREQVASVAVGHTAMGPTVAPDGKRLFVCNRFDDDVSVVDLDALRELARVPVVRQPVAAAVTPDGKWILVANHLPAGRADRFYIAADVTFIDARTYRATSIGLPNGATDLRDVCVSPDGRYAWITHILSNYELIPSQVDQGWTNINAMSVLDVHEKKPLNTIALDDPYLGAGNPWAVATTEDGNFICITHAGTHELSVIAAEALLRKVSGMYISPLVSGIPDDRGMMHRVRKRIKLQGKGPRGLAVVGSKAYVAGYFSDSLDVVDLRMQSGGQVGTIALGPEPQPTMQRRGEMLFHDATICYQQWQSCSSCHPDARADGLNWDLLNDGVGNSKNTKSMLLAHRTPPAMATGARPSAEEAVRSGIQNTLFNIRPEEEAVAIDEYLKSLQPVPSPHLIDGRLGPAAARGKEVFEGDRVGCARCHPAPLYTDLRGHDVGTRGPYDHHERFDTPTLIEVWRTAPYLHDGRYTTIKEVIEKGKHGLGRGRFEKLSRQQIDDLVEFVLSL